jgi:hypothetical protein
MIGRGTRQEPIAYGASQSSGQWLTIDYADDTTLERLLANGLDFFRQSGCEIIKWERKIKVGRVPCR